MRHTPIAAGLASLVLVALPAAAKEPSPSKVLKKATKTMAKLKSYRVTANVEGGMAQDPTHKLTQVRVRENYNCDVYGPVAKIAGSKEAFRLRKGREQNGTIRDGQVWKGILGTTEGRVMERLFKRPEDHFVALRKYAKLAKWLPPQAAKPIPGAQPVAVDGEDPDDKETRVRDTQKSKSGKADSGPTPTRLRLVAPANEAIDAFTTIVNSGCLGGG